jgi:hypothetical protein
LLGAGTRPLFDAGRTRSPACSPGPAAICTVQCDLRASETDRGAAVLARRLTLGTDGLGDLNLSMVGWDRTQRPKKDRM